MCVCVGVCVCVRACVLSQLLVCVRACVCVCQCVYVRVFVSVCVHERLIQSANSVTDQGAFRRLQTQCRMRPISATVWGQCVSLCQCQCVCVCVSECVLTVDIHRLHWTFDTQSIAEGPI